MTVSVISFTENGEYLSRRLAEQKLDFSVERYTKRKLKQEMETDSACTYVTEGLNDWARAQFERKNALLFIGHVGLQCVPLLL